MFLADVGRGGRIGTRDTVIFLTTLLKSGVVQMTVQLRRSLTSTATEHVR